MDLKEYKAAVEAILFAYAEPISCDRIAQVLEVEEAVVERLLYSLRDNYEKKESGVCLLQLEDRWQIATKNEYGDYIKLVLDTRRNMPLSPAALETLTIIAYNQPVSRSFIEQVRGVDSSSSVSNLQEKGLIEEAGRLDLPGHPISFRTTDAFLRTFGLDSISALPALHQEDALSEESVVVEEEYDGQMMAQTETDAEYMAEQKARADAKVAAKAALEATAAELKAASDAAASLVKQLKATEQEQQALQGLQDQPNAQEPQEQAQQVTVQEKLQNKAQQEPQAQEQVAQEQSQPNAKNQEPQQTATQTATADPALLASVPVELL